MMQHCFETDCNKFVCDDLLQSNMEKILFICWFVSEIGTGVKVSDSHLYGWSSIPGKGCRFFHKQKLITVLYVL